MIVLIIIITLLLGYSIYKTLKYSKLNTKCQDLVLELQETNMSLILEHTNSKRLLLMYEESVVKLTELNEKLLKSNTPIIIEPVITSDDAVEVVKPKRGRVKK